MVPRPIGRTATNGGAVRSVAASAQALHTVEHDLVRLCLDGAGFPDRAAIAGVREGLRRAREVMIGAARRSRDRNWDTTWAG